MRLSRSAILAPIPGRPDALLVQPLTGQVALLDADTAAGLARLGAGGAPPATLPLDALRDAGFVVADDEEDRRLLARAYAGYLRDLDRTPTQLLFVPTLGCNLRCTYCYQETLDPEGHGLASQGTIDAFFAYVDRYHADEPVAPYVTLFGGEPLVDTPAHHDRVGRVLAGAERRGLGVAVVTNGHDLRAFVPALAAARAREVQVTLDGPPELHDRRRPHGSGRGTFAAIVRGIDALVEARVPVNLRVVVDRENLEALPALAAIAEERGWLDLPEARMKTQVGRNYELFGCASRQRRDQLFDRLELWARYVELAEREPRLLRFHRPRLHGIRHLADTGELPPPNFDACPAAKKEWAFAPDGGLYGCTATVGNPRYRLGRYTPVVDRDEAAIARWQGRSALTIPACQGCAVATVCGGGCGAVAAEATGDPGAPDCRPVAGLLGLGARLYGLGEASSRT